MFLNKDLKLLINTFIPKKCKCYISRDYPNQNLLKNICASKGAHETKSKDPRAKKWKLFVGVFKVKDHTFEGICITNALSSGGTTLLHFAIDSAQNRLIHSDNSEPHLPQARFYPAAATFTGRKSIHSNQLIH